MSQECSIIKDLLPLYVTRDLQTDTLHFIENHVASCKHCQKLINQKTTSAQNRSMKRTFGFFHLLFIVLSFMSALNSSLLGNNFSFILSYALFGCLTYLYYNNVWIVFVISFTPVFVWAIINNSFTSLYINHTSVSDMSELIVGACFISILHTIFALFGSAIAIILKKITKK